MTTDQRTRPRLHLRTTMKAANNTVGWCAWMAIGLATSMVTACALETQDQAVYYDHQSKQPTLAGGDPSTVIGNTNEVVSGVAQNVDSEDPGAPQPPVQAGLSGLCNPATSKCDPEPSPWQGPGGHGASVTNPRIR